MNRRFEQELATGCHYEPLPSLPETELRLPDLVGGEGYEWAAIDNLDAFFTRVYRYWHDKGLITILVGRLLNLTALAFTICFSGFLLLAVNWSALHSDCLIPHEPHMSCDLLSVAIHRRPWTEHPKALVVLVGFYLGLCGVYWVWSAVQLAVELRDVLDVKHFINNKLGISDRQIRMMTWSELLHRLVLVQRTTRLCASRDLNELDVVNRIMRKDNYLIGMLNAGVLALYVRGCGPMLGRRFMLTKTLEWNLYLCILDPMFDEHFHIRKDFLADERRLKRRLVGAAALNALLSPFLLLFLVIYFFMKHAEKFYHSPGSLGSRRWSSLAKWRLRELNELPHYIQHRLDASYEAAVKYVGQFPSPLVSQTAKFVSFIAGSFAALLLGLSLLDENLLEVPLGGRNVVWWLALTGILLTVSRSFINDTPVAFDPERAMAELVLHTHYLPRHWRGKAHSAEVQQAVNSLFTFKILLFFEELASVVLTPFILAYSLPRCAGAILDFVASTTTHIEGVGDVCGLAAFEFERHGNSKYGAPTHAAKKLRSKQGKLEKSFLTFVATYPTWKPPTAGRQMLTALGSISNAGGSHLLGSTAPPQQQLRQQQQRQQQQQQAEAGSGAYPGSLYRTQDGAASEIWHQSQHFQPQQQHADGGSSCWVGVSDKVPHLRQSYQMQRPWQTNCQQHQQHIEQLAWHVQQPQRPPEPHDEQHHPQQQQQQKSDGWLALQQQQQQQQHPLSMSAASTPSGQLHTACQSPNHHPLGLDAGLSLDEHSDGHAIGIIRDGAGGAAVTAAVDRQDEQGEGLLQGSDEMLNAVLPDVQPIPHEQHQQHDLQNQQQKVPQQQLGTVLGSEQQGAAKAVGAPVHSIGAVVSPAALQGDVADVLSHQAGRWQNQQQQQWQQQQWQQHCQPSTATAAFAAAPAATVLAARRSRLHSQQQPRHHLPPQQQQQQQQCQPPPLRYASQQSLLLGASQYSLLPSMAPSQQLMQLFPSTLYPGGPSAAAMSQLHLASAAHPAFFGNNADGSSCDVAPGASLLAQSAAGSDLLPTNETDELSSRVAASQSLLQSFYEGQDVTVQHRQHNRAHERSVLMGHSDNAAAAAAAVAGMAAASESHSAVQGGDW